MRFGMDYGGTNVKVGVFDARGEAVAFREDPLPTFTAQGDLLENLLRHASFVASGYPLKAGGLAIKGQVNSSLGRVEEDIGAGSLLAGKDLRTAFSRALGVPFVLENDARSYAWGEWRFGAGRGTRAMVCMTLGTGIGCAVIVENQAYHGANELGGLLGGHLSIDRHGPRCACGNHGCLELYCSALALRRRVLDIPDSGLLPENDPLKQFFAGVRNGDARFRPLFQAIIEDLALGVVNVVHAYSPDVVVLGGGVMNSADVILPPLAELVARMAWTVPRGSVHIRRSELGNRAAALGAAFHPLLPEN